MKLTFLKILSTAVLATAILALPALAPPAGAQGCDIAHVTTSLTSEEEDACAG